MQEDREGQWTGGGERGSVEKRASGETMAAAVRSSQRSKPHHLALDRFVAHRFVAHTFVTRRFVTHRFVASRFVAHTFVAHRFVAQSCFKVE